MISLRSSNRQRETFESCRRALSPGLFPSYTIAGTCLPTVDCRGDPLSPGDPGVGAGTRDPTLDKVMRRNPDRQGGSGFQGFWKSGPGTHLKDDICLSDACFNRLLPNFCDTGRRPSPISSQIRTLINKFHRWWYFMRLSRVKGVF